MKKESNEKVIVDKQITYLLNNYYKDKLINLPGRFPRDSNSYGSSFYIKSNEYEDVYKKVLESNSYFYLLSDQSIINLNYQFDNIGKVIAHTLTFLPPPHSKTYIRIDYNCDSGNHDKKHPDVHLHITTDSDNCRIPVDSVVMPFDFIYLILKYFYYDNNNFVNSLKIGQGKCINCSKNSDKAAIVFK